MDGDDVTEDAIELALEPFLRGLVVESADENGAILVRSDCVFVVEWLPYNRWLPKTVCHGRQRPKHTSGTSQQTHSEQDRGEEDRGSCRNLDT